MKQPETELEHDRLPRALFNQFDLTRQTGHLALHYNYDLDCDSLTEFFTQIFLNFRLLAGRQALADGAPSDWLYRPNKVASQQIISSDCINLVQCDHFSIRYQTLPLPHSSKVIYLSTRSLVCVRMDGA